MEKMRNYAKIIRNNWKKSTLGAIALYYGALKAKEKYEIRLLMQAACKEALKYGDETIDMMKNPTFVTVILNPVANKRRAKQDYEKYCEPLLHLAGLQVDVIQTASEGNAKELVETLSGTEAIVVAGGDGTLSESVTGLLRRSDEANRFPLGILPLGRTNTIGNTLFAKGDGVGKVKQLIEATMAIIRGHTVQKDAMKIEPIAPDDEDPPGKAIYALSSVEWGAFRDTISKQHLYWMYGSLKQYAAFIFNGYRETLNWHCKGIIKYSPPCDGCSNCLKKRPEYISNRKKWFFIPTMAQQTQDNKDMTNVVNTHCETTKELCFKTSDFRIVTPNIQNTSTTPALSIGIGKYNYSYTAFINDGWDRVKNNSISNAILARSVMLIPHEDLSSSVLDIDREEYEAKPIKVTLLPKVIKLFCSC